MNECACAAWFIITRLYLIKNFHTILGN